MCLWQVLCNRSHVQWQQDWHWQINNAMVPMVICGIWYKYYLIYLSTFCECAQKHGGPDGGWKYSSPLQVYWPVPRDHEHDYSRDGSGAWSTKGLCLWCHYPNTWRIQWGSATVTYCSNNSYAHELIAKMRKGIVPWLFHYWRLLCRYKLTMVLILIESFNTNAAFLARFSKFYVNTLKVTTSFCD